MSNVETLIEDWLTAKRELVLATEKERVLRDSVVEALFPDAKRGTNNHILSDGRVAKYVRGLNIKLVNAKRDAIPILDAQIAGRLPFGLIKEKVSYEINEAKYAGLSDDQKRFLSGAIEVKDKAPVLSVE